MSSGENLHLGKIVGINGNIITAEFEGTIKQNEVAFALIGDVRLKAEVIRIKGKRADLQIFENTKGLKIGNLVELTGKLLSVEVGPGLLGQLYDGLQNPLHQLGEESGFFLERGKYIFPLSTDKEWEFTPLLQAGDQVGAGDALGQVPEGIFQHKIMVPFHFQERGEIVEIVEKGKYRLQDCVAKVKSEKGEIESITLSFSWPVKRAVTCYQERLAPTTPLVTQIRIIDTLFPVALGGTYCIPGPFGAGKTVLQQITSRYAKVDIVIIAACGERANEVVETIKTFPELIDPLTGKSLMERTVIICNTSSMPVAARESSIYTAIAIGEYYRQMGLNVLMLADSTSRWAQAMRERSGRLEEIPGEEAFPAYLESVIAAFYERSGMVQLKDGNKGSLTIGGTVSPAGGNFEEPVTQSTLKVVGAFHGLSRERSDARKFPAIDPLESWTRYSGIISSEERRSMIRLLTKSNEIEQMMKVVGEEGTSLEDYLFYLKGEFFDEIYLQQNAFHKVDAATSEERQKRVFAILQHFLKTPMDLKSKKEARELFNKLRQIFLDYNCAPWESDLFFKKEKEFVSLVEEHDAFLHKTNNKHLGRALVESSIDSDFRRSRQA